MSLTTIDRALDHEGEPIGPYPEGLITIEPSADHPTDTAHDVPSFYKTVLSVTQIGGEAVRAFFASKFNEVQQYFPSPE